ncbi:MAG: 4Fe-4S binding protein [Acidimicrobiia bacterium]|nr:4Fe-4S binding protein [Acidimicrobiia bacterium]
MAGERHRRHCGGGDVDRRRDPAVGVKTLVRKPPADERRLDVLGRMPRLRRVVMSRSFQPVSMLLLLAPFALAIVAGLLGTSAGNRNFGIVFVWIVWWAVLMVLMVPGFGRIWCTICPIPAPGEWIQRRGIIGGGGKLRTLGLRWPRRLRNMWIQNVGFLILALFSMIILTRPTVSAGVILGLAGVAVSMSLLFENRVFCKYVCPIGGFIGLYSMAAPIELRVRDTQVCVDHRSKDCITGNERGYGCPWMVYPGKLDRNLDCGFCTECLKTCTMDNVVINLRRPGADLAKPGGGKQIDEAYKALIMLACSIIYPAVLFGPWATVRGWASVESLWGWAIYATAFLSATLLFVPGVFWLTVFAAQRRSATGVTIRQAYREYAHSLIPLGLAAWMAFSVGFALTNGSYALAAVSDPLGWGWNLFGTSETGWTPYLSGTAPAIQAAILVGGLLFSIRTTLRVGFRHDPSGTTATRAAVPVVAFLLASTLALLWLYLG